MTSSVNDIFARLQKICWTCNYSQHCRSGAPSQNPVQWVIDSTKRFPHPHPFFGIIELFRMLDWALALSLQWLRNGVGGNIWTMSRYPWGGRIKWVVQGRFLVALVNRSTLRLILNGPASTLLCSPTSFNSTRFIKSAPVERTCIFSYRELTRGMRLVLPTELSLCRLAGSLARHGVFHQRDESKKKGQRISNNDFPRRWTNDYIRKISKHKDLHIHFYDVKLGLSNYEKNWRCLGTWC